MMKTDFWLVKLTVLTGIPVGAVLFAAGFLVIFLLLLWIWSKFISSISAKIQAKIETRKNAEKEKAALELKPILEKRERILKEKILPFYLEEFKNAPIGYWCNPRDSFSRVVSYEDWEFLGNGTGRYVFFTLGSGENSYPFHWENTGSMQIRIIADNEEDGWLFTNELNYHFVVSDSMVLLVRNGYDPDGKYQPGSIGELYLNGGPVYEKRETLFQL